MNGRTTRLSPFPALALLCCLGACGGDATAPAPDGAGPAEDAPTGGADSEGAPEIATTYDAANPAPGDDAATNTASDADNTDGNTTPADVTPQPDVGGADATTPEGPCPAGTTCTAGWCTSPRVTDQCVTDSDCPGAGTFCNAEAVGGICLGCGDDADCPDGLTCTDFGACASACDVDDDCPTGRCFAAQGLCGQRACAVDADCPAGTMCLDGGQCGRVSCPDPCQPDPCSAANSVCVAEGADGHRCDCAPGFAREGADCVAVDTGACSGGQGCLGGLCADRGATGFQCAVDADCGAGRTCSPALPSGICQGCASAADCPAGHDRCLAGRCLKSCASASDCHPGMRCNNGVCGQLPCTAHADCGPDHDCDLTAAEPRCVRRSCE